MTARDDTQNIQVDGDDYVSCRDEIRIPARINRIELFIHAEDEDFARKVIDDV